MDGTKLILTEAVPVPKPLGQLSGTIFCDNAAKLKVGEIKGFSEEKKKQVAKDFEWIFINKLLEQMSSTIGEWGFEKDSASKQVQGIFCLYMAQDIANNGGLGMWKDVYKFLTDSVETNTTEKPPGTGPILL